MPIEQAKQRLETPLTDNNITRYLPNSPIYTYSDLKNFKDINELFHSSPYVVLLYEWKKNEGHWVSLAKHKHKFLYFDPFGYKIDYFLNENSKELNFQLGQTQPFLSQLLKGHPVETNKIVYQDRNNYDLATCGRHIIWFGLNLLKRNYGLSQYYKMMREIQKRTGLSYDVIVSYYIK